MGEVGLGRMEFKSGVGKKGLTEEGGGAMSARRDVQGQFTAAAGNGAASGQRGSRGLA